MPTTANLCYLVIFALFSGGGFGNKAGMCRYNSYALHLVNVQNHNGFQCCIMPRNACQLSLPACVAAVLAVSPQGVSLMWQDGAHWWVPHALSMGMPNCLPAAFSV